MSDPVTVIDNDNPRVCGSEGEETEAEREIPTSLSNPDIMFLNVGRRNIQAGRRKSLAASASNPGAIFPWVTVCPFALHGFHVEHQDHCY